MRLLLTFYLLFNALFEISAMPFQPGPFPEVGRTCPIYTLRNIKYYRLRQAGPSDFKGKWLVLDFWNKNCGSCVASFPRTDAMQKVFHGKVQFMLVALQDRQGQIEPMYDRFREKEQLDLPCAFDSGICNQWCISTCPHIIIIDPAGMVQGVTNHVDSGQMASFLRGDHPSLVNTYHSQCRDFDDPRDATVLFNPKKPFLMDGNGGNDSDFLYRSILSRWRPGQPGFDHEEIDYPAVDARYPKGYFQIMRLPLSNLYLYAYFGRNNWAPGDTAWYGKYLEEPIVEAPDSDLFHYDYGPTFKNLFCYSLIIPGDQGNGERLRQIMQRDLKNYFGFDASIETRRIHCWKLIATADARLKLRTNGGQGDQYTSIIPRARFRLHNAHVQRLILAICGFVKGDIFDETGIDSNIDITMDCVNLDDMLQSLHANGLSLVPTEKDMKAIVIRDPKDATTFTLAP